MTRWQYDLAWLLVCAALAACALTANQAHVPPDYPAPSPLEIGAPRDAGRE